MFRKSCFFFVLLSFGPCLTGQVHAEIDGKKIAKLRASVFCINAGVTVAWETAQQVFKEMEIPLTLEDSQNHLMTTAFVAADTKRLRSLSSNAKFFSNGRFTLKLFFEEMSPDYTRLHVTLQIRQSKWVGKDERLLKSRGSFEKFLAYRINQLAIGKQFPDVYQIRIGFDLIPDISSGRYLIRHVEENSPAGESGFRDGDILMEMDHKPVTIRGELFRLLSEVQSERLLTVTIRRRDAEVQIPLWIIRVGESEEKIGMSLSWDAKAKAFHVIDVDSDSRAAKGGLRRGDRLLKEGDLTLNGWSNYYRVLAREKPGVPVTLLVERDGRQIDLTL